jgi:hypothetical protein
MKLYIIIIVVLLCLVIGGVFLLTRKESNENEIGIDTSGTTHGTTTITHGTTTIAEQDEETTKIVTLDTD